VNYWWTAIPARKLPGFADDTSTKLNVERSAATCMLKFQPQPTPQDKFAVPLPLELSELTVKVCPGSVESPHCPWVVRVAVPVPFVLRVKVACIATRPQPVLPVKLTTQGPDRSALPIVPVAELGVVMGMIVMNDSTTKNVRRAG